MATKVKVTVMNDALRAALATMLGAVESEADTRIKAEQEMLASGASAWSKCRDTVLTVLGKGGKEGAADVRALLGALRTACTEAKEAKPYMGRGLQYASDLGRAAKAADKGLNLPKELTTATRKEWTESKFWSEQGLLSAAGKPAGSGKPEGGEAEGEEAEGGNVGKAATADKALSDLMGVVGQLRGPFRKEFFKEAEMLAVSILAKQRAASGSGESAANVTAKPEAPAKRANARK